MGDAPTFLAAFTAGLLSFVSPCVLPLIPGYLSYISGLSLDEMQGTGITATATAVARRRVLAASIFFILGFSFVFISFGAAATALGQFMLDRHRIFARVAGLLVIVFGLHTMGLLRIGWLYSEKRVQMNQKPTGMIGAFFVGLAFAFGWTPCIGPILAGILAVAGAQETVGQGVRLLAVYLARARGAVSRHRPGHQPVLRGIREDPEALSRDRDRVRSAPLRDRRADLHRPLHADRDLAHAVSADVLKEDGRMGRMGGWGSHPHSSYPPILLSSYPPILPSSYPPILLAIVPECPPPAGASGDG